MEKGKSHNLPELLPVVLEVCCAIAESAAQCARECPNMADRIVLSLRS